MHMGGAGYSNRRKILPTPTILNSIGAKNQSTHTHFGIRYAQETDGRAKMRAHFSEGAAAPPYIRACQTPFKHTPPLLGETLVCLMCTTVYHFGSVFNAYYVRYSFIRFISYCQLIVLLVESVGVDVYLGVLPETMAQPLPLNIVRTFGHIY